mmetsp:Transcript_30824/g.46516  ORF Transcript_30824/g.46516 Transcript_30824/m.46516 type:complete len:211 (-) Transcript_30824:130-762(-)
MAAALALSQFVHLAQSQQGKACEAIVKQVLDHSNIFVFGELLECPNVQAISASPEGAKLLELLRVFAYGTYQDYKARADSLPALTPAQKRKLQLLTIVSMASKERRIPFSDIGAAVEMDSTRELEDLIIDAVYQNLIDAKMDQEKQCLEVLKSTCRDCKDEDIDFIIETLTAWGDSASGMLETLETTKLSDLPFSPQLLSQAQGQAQSTQ